jgi:enterochelin esterase-like enzyme
MAAMKRLLRFLHGLGLLVLLAALSACGGGGSDGAPAADSPPPAEAVGQVIRSSLPSRQTGYTYTIQVFLPASYATGTASLPVIYATEGDAPYGSAVGGVAQSRFDVFKAAMQRRGTQAILVGISGTERRVADFLMPGARSYVDFIALELAPAIERQYRANPARRALSGLSHGGYLAVAALILEGSTGRVSFSHYLATDPSVGNDGSIDGVLNFEKQLDLAGKPVPATLFLGGARSFNGPVANALYTQFTEHAHPGLTVARTIYETSHVGSDLPAFEEALERYFP